MKKFILLPCLILLISCSSTYDNFYKLDSQYLAQRQLSTRYFELDDEKELIIASAQLLQDLGYLIEESNTNLGFLTGTKNREILNDGAVITVTTLAVLASVFTNTHVNTNLPKMRELKATVVINKSHTRSGYNVRVEFASVTYYTHGNIVLERNTDNKTYQEFFEKLGQSIFLTPQDI